MLTTSLISLVYGLIVLVGGIFGYIKASSIPSLIAGMVFGIALLLCSWGISKDLNYASVLSWLIALVLTAFFSYRFALTQAFMPAGMMAIFSLLAFLLLFFMRK